MKNKRRLGNNLLRMSSNYHQFISRDLESWIIPEDMISIEVREHLVKHGQFPFSYEDDEPEWQAPVYYIPLNHPRIIKSPFDERSRFNEGYKYASNVRIIRTWIIHNGY